MKTGWKAQTSSMIFLAGKKRYIWSAFYPNSKTSAPMTDTMFFGDFLHMLVQQGFRLSPRDYLQVQELLAGEENFSAGESFSTGENFSKVSNFGKVGKANKAENLNLRPAETFRHQLAALLCHSPEEQHIFHETWERFIEKHSYIPKEEAPPPARRDWLRLLPGIIAALTLLIALGSLGWRLFRPQSLNLAEIKKLIVLKSSEIDEPDFRGIINQDYAFTVGLLAPKLPADFSLDSVKWEYSDGFDTLLYFEGKNYADFSYRFQKSRKYRIKVHLWTSAFEMDSVWDLNVLPDDRIYPEIDLRRFDDENRIELNDISLYLGKPEIFRDWYVNTEVI
jgi:hypothetical protein